MSAEAPASPPPPPPPPKPAARPRAPDRLARTLATIALLLAAVGGWLAVQARVGVQGVESSAGDRLAQLGEESARLRANLGQAQASLREAQGRIGELEGRVSDTQEQRVALEQMYRDLARSADDRVLSEVEQVLVLASQQLQLAGNVRAALAALQAADQRLARAEKLAATPLRRAIERDMERLKAVPQVDIEGLAVKIDSLIRQADTLPLLVSETAPAVRKASRWRGPEAPQGIVRVWRDFWDEMKSLVRIRNMDTEDAALLTPAQSYFLRQNLRLRLLSARVALLARDEPSFREDMRAAQAWMAKYFDTKAKPTATALAVARQVAGAPVVVAVPDINASLAAVRTARAAREKQ